MDLYYSIILAGIILVAVGFLGCLAWIVLDNKKFYEELDKQRYGWYNKEEEKPRRAKRRTNTKNRSGGWSRSWKPWAA